MPTQLAEESNALTVFHFESSNILIIFFTLYHELSVSRRTLQCRVRDFTPTYDMTKELQLKDLLKKYPPWILVNLLWNLKSVQYT